ncbi:MAG: HAD family hydrolase [Fibrobacter sp.]|nr:HAD family hydrolase [Fibrobacter sp.]
MPNALIFDLDGTLWDTVAPLTLIWNQVFQKNGTGKVISEDDLRNVMGKNLQEISAIYFPDMERSRREDILNQCAVAHCAYLKEHGAPLFFDKDFLIGLSAKYELFIVSNCPCGYIEAFLESQNLQKYFKDYEMSGRTGKSKGENIKTVMERNGCLDCVYIGDTVGDETAARTADIPFIHAAYGFGSANNPAAVIQNFNELLEILEKLF